MIEKILQKSFSLKQMAIRQILFRKCYRRQNPRQDFSDKTPPRRQNNPRRERGARAISAPCRRRSNKEHSTFE